MVVVPKCVLVDDEQVRLGMGENEPFHINVGHWILADSGERLERDLFGIRDQQVESAFVVDHRDKHDVCHPSRGSRHINDSQKMKMWYTIQCTMIWQLWGRY
jgi:hypothetical protein